MAQQKRHKNVAVFCCICGFFFSRFLCLFPLVLLISCCFMLSWNPETAHQVRLQAKHIDQEEEAEEEEKDHDKELRRRKRTMTRLWAAMAATVVASSWARNAAIMVQLRILGPATNPEPRSEVCGEICGGVLVENASDDFPQPENLENILPNFAGSSPPILPTTSPTSLWKSLVLRIQKPQDDPIYEKNRAL